ncbi:uncharacterized protein LOC144431922 [Styela clava]
MMKSARKRFAKGKHVTSEPASMEHGDIVNITKRKIRPSSKVVENRKQEFDQQRQSVSKLCQKLVKLCETAKHVSHILRASSAMRASSRQLMEMWSALEEMVSRKERTSLFRGIQQVDREVKDATRIAEETVDNLMEKRDESSSRSSTYRTSASSIVSRKSEKIALNSKQEWYDLQKDVGELEVKVKSVEEEKLLNLQALQLEYQRKMKILADESQLQMHKLMQQSQLELHLHKKELESKKARAQVCKKVQQVENPFGLNEEDFIANSSSQQSQILKSDWDHSLKTIHGADNSNDIVCENINLGMNSQHANAFQHSPSGAYTTFVSPEVNMNSVSHLNNDLSACLRELAISNSMLANAYALPQIKVDIFDGNPLKFPAWESDFDALIEAKTTNVRQKLNLLSQHLSGDPKTMIQDLVLLQSDTAYAEAKEKLKSRYGNESVICKAFLDKLASWPRIRFRDAAGIQRYGDFLDQVKVAKHKIKDLEVLDFSVESVKVIERLPTYLQDAWRGTVKNWRSKYGKNSYPPFDEIVKFVNEASEKENIPELEHMNKNREYVKSYDDREKKSKSFSSYRSAQNARAYAHKVENMNANKCPFCSVCHHIDDCDEFGKLSIKDKKTFFLKERLCYGCGSNRGHRVNFCKQRVTCKICNKLHLTALHVDKTLDKSDSKCTQVCTIEGQSGGKHNSMIVPVFVRNSKNPSKEIQCYCILDDQSNCCFVSEELQKQLDVKDVQTQLNLSTMMKSGALVSSQRIRGLQVMSMDRQVKIDIPQAYTREQVPASPSQIPKPEVAKQWKHLEKIADKLMPYDSKLKVSILIGSNIPSAVRPRDIIHGRENDPYGQKSILGWGIIGNVCKNGKHDDKSSISHRVEVTQDCSTAENLLESNGKSSFVFSTKVKEIVSPQQLNQMMEIDFVDHKSKHENMSIEDQRFVKILSENVIKCDNGMYEMPLPLKCDQVKLPNNKPMVLKRVMQLKKRFEKDSEYKSKYVEFMEDMIKNYAERVPENRLVVSDGKVNYVPHTAVFHSKKKTIRVVFDLSALYKGECINDHLLTGPDLMSGMTGILCRFRKEEIAVMGDIKGMFHQFVVREQDRDLLRFFWWNNGNTESELTEYRMTRHPFGARSSPGVAMYGLKLAGDDGEKAFGIEAADFVRDNFYVDDGLQSLETVNEAKLLIKNSTSLCAKAGLKLHKFVSNRREVLESIPECDRASSVKTIDLNNDPLPIERVLGMLWDVNDDVFRYHSELKNQPRTRRGFLSIVSSIFDPMGFLSPVILEGKKILQELCKSKIDWDDPIPENVQPRVNAWIDDLHGIDNLTISRCIKPPNFGVVKVVEMHHFSDACQSGYGQCSYVRLVNENGDSHCTLLMGKSRVAPLKQISIPRMELTAATISARMSRYLREELRYENIKEYFWVDSMVVLGYVNNPVKRFHVFVANRVQQILDVSDVSKWLHVESNQNPSDLASRGISVKKLIADSKWWNGPEFLQCKGAYEPPEVSYVPNNKTDALLKHEMKKATAFITVEKENTVGYNFDIDRLDIFSSWFKAKRAVANCIRFCHKLRKVDCANNLEVENLSISEKVIIRCLQQIHFSEEIEQLQSCAVSGAILDRAKIKIRNKLSRSSIYKLDPYIDEDGLICVGGRIGRANMPMDCKHPLLLPRHSHVTNLIIRHFI